MFYLISKRVWTWPWFSLPLLMLFSFFRSSQGISSKSATQLRELDSSEYSPVSLPLSKQEEPCFTTKQMSSLVVCPLVDSSFIILSFSVNDAFEEHAIERSLFLLVICTSLEISSCIQCSVSENKLPVNDE